MQAALTDELLRGKYHLVPFSGHRTSRQSGSKPPAAPRLCPGPCQPPSVFEPLHDSPCITRGNCLVWPNPLRMWGREGEACLVASGKARLWTQGNFMHLNSLPGHVKPLSSRLPARLTQRRICFCECRKHPCAALKSKDLSTGLGSKLQPSREEGSKEADLGGAQELNRRHMPGP